MTKSGQIKINIACRYVFKRVLDCEKKWPLSTCLMQLRRDNMRKKWWVVLGPRLFLKGNEAWGRMEPIFKKKHWIKWSCRTNQVNTELTEPNQSSNIYWTEPENTELNGIWIFKYISFCPNNILIDAQLYNVNQYFCILIIL